MKPDLVKFIPIILRFLPIFMRLLPIFIKLFPLFERFVPIPTSYILERTMKTLKTKGSIKDYRTRISRTSKFTYRIDIKIAMNEEQIKILLKDLVSKIQRLIG